jgi:hypothetical protein
MYLAQVYLGHFRNKGAAVKKHPKGVEYEEVPNDDENVRLNPEDIDESQQSIEEAAYYIGLKRKHHNLPGDHLSDWFEAEKAVKENLD